MRCASANASAPIPQRCSWRNRYLPDLAQRVSHDFFFEHGFTPADFVRANFGGIRTALPEQRGLVLHLPGKWDAELGLPDQQPVRMLGYLRSRRRKSLQRAEEEGRRSAEECMAACKDMW